MTGEKLKTHDSNAVWFVTLVKMSSGCNEFLPARIRRVIWLRLLSDLTGQADLGRQPRQIESQRERADSWVSKTGPVRDCTGSPTETAPVIGHQSYQSRQSSVTSVTCQGLYVLMTRFVARFKYR